MPLLSREGTAESQLTCIADGIVRKATNCVGVERLELYRVRSSSILLSEVTIPSTRYQGGHTEWSHILCRKRNVHSLGDMKCYTDACLYRSIA